MKGEAGVGQSQTPECDNLQEFVVTLHKNAPVDAARVRATKFTVRRIVGFFCTACSMNSPSVKSPKKWPHGGRINMETMMRISVRGNDSVIQHPVNLGQKLGLNFFWRNLAKDELTAHLSWTEKITVAIHQRADRTRRKNRSALAQIQVNAYIKLRHPGEWLHCISLPGR